MSNTISNITDIRHCSECKHFWTAANINPTQMYCTFHKRRITQARKKVCKEYETFLAK